MNIILRVNENINFKKIAHVVNESGLPNRSEEIVETAYGNSYMVVCAFDDKKLVGVGRALSDGISDAVIHDIAVLTAYQKRGIGTKIIKELITQLKGQNIILFAIPGVEPFYKKLGFSKMLTAMAIFRHEEQVRSEGIIE